MAWYRAPVSVKRTVPCLLSSQATPGLDSKDPADAKNVKGRVLVLHGAADPYVPPAEVAAFQREMDEAKVDWQMVFYAGAVHSFTNPAAGNAPSKGAAYDARADRRSWEAMKAFLAEEAK